MPPADPADPTPRVVLDTNVVLDWLLFRDAACTELAGRVQSRQLVWLATAPMRAELQGVLSLPRLAAWGPDAEHILRVFDELASIRGAAPACGPALICRDPSDQKFIDLAVAAHAGWLFSKDRALLSLARRARRFGVQILRPDGWRG